MEPIMADVHLIPLDLFLLTLVCYIFSHPFFENIFFFIFKEDLLDNI